MDCVSFQLRISMQRLAGSFLTLTAPTELLAGSHAEHKEMPLTASQWNRTTTESKVWSIFDWLLLLTSILTITSSLANRPSSSQWRSFLMVYRCSILLFCWLWSLLPPTKAAFGQWLKKPVGLPCFCRDAYTLIPVPLMDLYVVLDFCCSVWLIVCWYFEFPQGSWA